MRPMKDPAPSRLAYRMNRLMLTPTFRAFLRFGLPVLILATLGLWWASDETRLEMAKDRVAEVKRQIEERPEFMVRMMAVEDASDVVSAEVRATLALDFPITSFDLDLDALRTRVEEIDAVAAASVRLRKGGVLEIEITERAPVVVWRHADGLELLDLEGHRVAYIPERAMRADLPLIAGEGAGQHVGEALALIRAADPLLDRVRALKRMGERRWDLVLDRDQRVLLPEEAPVSALEKVIALDLSQDVLARDVKHVDMRNPARPVIRLTETATEALYEPIVTSSEDTSQ